MTLAEVVVPGAIILSLSSNTKKDVIAELVNVLCSSLGNYGSFLDSDSVIRSITEREELSSTGICNGLAIPHAKVEGIDRIFAGIGLSKEGIDFDAIDNIASKIFFVLISPKRDNKNHVRVLAQITRLLKEARDREGLLSCVNSEEVLTFIKNKSKEKAI